MTTKNRFPHMQKFNLANTKPNKKKKAWYKNPPYKRTVA